MRLSKKLVTTAGSLLGLLLADLFGIQLRPETLDAIVEIAAWYLGAQGAVDVVQAFRPPETVPLPPARVEDPFASDDDSWPQ